MVARAPQHLPEGQEGRHRAALRTRQVRTAALPELRPGRVETALMVEQGEIQSQAMVPEDRALPQAEVVPEAVIQADAPAIAEAAALVVAVTQRAPIRLERTLPESLCRL